MLNVTLDSLGLETVRGDESFVSRVQDMPVSKEEFFDLTKMAKYVGVTEQFKDVINTFQTQQIRHLILHREPEKLRVRAEIGNEHLRAGGLADGTAYAEGKQVRHHGRKETAHRIADKIRSPDDVGKTRLDGHGNGRRIIQRG